MLTHNGSAQSTTVTWTSPNDLLSAEGLHATGRIAIRFWRCCPGSGRRRSVGACRGGGVGVASSLPARWRGAAAPRYQQPCPGAMQQYQPGAPGIRGGRARSGCRRSVAVLRAWPTPANMAYPPGQPQGPYPPGQPQGPYPPGPGVPGPTAQWGSPHEPEPTLPLPDEPSSGWVMPPRPPAPGAGPRS